MQKTLISLALILALATAQLSVTLSPKNVTSTVGAATVTSDVFYSAKAGDQQTINFNIGQNGDSINAGAAVSKPVVLGSEDQKTSQLTFAQSTTNKLTDLTIGLQMPANDQLPFLSSRIGTSFRLLSQSFSFLFNDKVNKVFFGQPQYYLAEKLSTIQLSHY